MQQQPSEENPTEPASKTNPEESFSIDAIKGFGVPKEESIKKKPRKPKDPKIKLTPEFLTGEKGISLLLKKARKLNLKKNHPITQRSDVLMTMYREWVKELYGLDQFEDVLSKIRDLSQHMSIRNMMDGYRDVEIQKYRLDNQTTDSIHQTNPIVPIDSIDQATNQS